MTVGPVASEVAKVSHDKTFCSHIIGIAKKHNMKWDSEIDKNTYPKIVSDYEHFTGQRYGGENLHAGKTIVFSQFVKSAMKHYRTG